MPLIALPAVPAAVVALGKAAAFVGSAAVAAWGVNEGIQAMSSAEDDAQDRTDAGTQATTDTCTDCDDPCQHLACGVPGSTYRGGAHYCTQEPGFHSHHMPAKRYSSLAEPAGPAIQMDRTDHYLTASYGGGVHGARYAPQRAALANGQTMAAIMMDVADVKAIAAAQGQPGKYDGAIAQMLAYANCLKQNGLIQ